MLHQTAERKKDKYTFEYILETFEMRVTIGHVTHLITSGHCNTARGDSRTCRFRETQCK